MVWCSLKWKCCAPKAGAGSAPINIQDFPRAKLQLKPAEKMKPTKVVTCEAPPLLSKPPGAAWSSPDSVLALSIFELCSWHICCVVSEWRALVTFRRDAFVPSVITPAMRDSRWSNSSSLCRAKSDAKNCLEMTFGGKVSVLCPQYPSISIVLALVAGLSGFQMPGCADAIQSRLKRGYIPSFQGRLGIAFFIPFSELKETILPGGDHRKYRMCR